MKKDNLSYVGVGDNGFKVALSATNFYDQDFLRLQEAAQWMAEALGSKEFMDFCRKFGYEITVCSGKWWWKNCWKQRHDEFNDNEGYDNEEIYNILMSGKEKLSTDGADREADVFLELDRRSNRRVLGYTYANSTKQWIYNNFFRNGDIWDVAGNIAHEWVHKMGFTHDYKYTSTREFSVPYAVGYFVRDYVEKKLTQQQLAI